MAFSVGIRQSFNRWDGVGLEQIEEELLSPTALESLGNIAIDEERKRLRGGGQVWKVKSNVGSSLCPSCRIRLRRRLKLGIEGDATIYMCACRQWHWARSMPRIFYFKPNSRRLFANTPKKTSYNLLYILTIHFVAARD